MNMNPKATFHGLRASCIFATMLLVAGQPAAGAARAQDDGLRIVVLEGEDSVNIIEQGTAVPTLVEVRDSNDLPVVGAEVAFLLQGGNATLNAGLSQVAVTTNALGQAAVTVNPISSGAVQLSVNAAFQGQTATAAIVQTNFATAAEAAAAGAGAASGAGSGSTSALGGGASSGGGLGTGAAVGIAGAAAGGAVGVGVALGGDDSAPAAPVPPAPAPDDRDVLVEFYHATDGPNWVDNTNWNSDAPLDQWFGVGTDTAGRVRSLVLEDNQLSGTIPSSLGNLANLESLNLFTNQLSGTIPSSLGDLANLRSLDLAINQLSGTIPSSLGDLANLESLDLDVNQLSGTIPSSLGDLANLEYLALNTNQLSGTIPSSLGDLANLDRLWLVSNQLSGTIPSSLGNLANLEKLYLSENQLSGTIPSSLGDLVNLEVLWLSDNRLSGSIPAALCKFEDGINPQMGGVYLPCAAGVPEISLVPGDGRLDVGWTASSDGGSAVEDYDVRYRRAGGSGAWTELADRTRSAAAGATITGLTNGAAYEVQVRAGGGEWSAAATGVPSAAVTPVTFGGARVEDQRWTRYAEAAPLVLPAAAGGVGALTYALAPSLPAGLAFDPAARTISGTPSAASAATYTYTATDAASPPDRASLTFRIEVEESAEEEALRRDALAAQGRALLSSVTGVVGERFRAGRARPAGTGAGRGGGLGAPGNALAALLGLPAAPGRGVRAGGAGFGPGGPPAVGFVPGGLSGLSGPGSGAGPPGASGSVPAGGGDAPSAPRPGLFGVGAGGRDGLAWGRSFAAPLGGGGTADRTSRYTLWGAGDRQSFSGSSVAGRYSGDLRSLYVGADGRLGADWLAGAAVGRSWGTADYAAAAGRGAAGRLTTRLTGVYPYLRGRVSRGPELWAVGGYGRGEAADARGTEAFGEPGALTMTMAAAGLRQAVAERGGVALAVVGGAGSLSLSSADGGRTVAGLAARVHRGRLALEASRASGAVSPFVQLGGRWDGGDGQTGGGLEVVTGLRASTARLDLEGRGRWLSAHAAAGYQEYGVTARLAVRPRPDGTGLRAALAPRWGAAGELSLGGDGLLGGAGAAGLRPGAPWTPGAQALALEGEVGYGWRPRRLRGVLSPMTSYRRTGFGGNLTRVGLSWLSSEERLRRNLRLQLTLGREQWRERGVGYQWAVAAASTF